MGDEPDEVMKKFDAAIEKIESSVEENIALTNQQQQTKINKINETCL